MNKKIAVVLSVLISTIGINNCSKRQSLSEELKVKNDIPTKFILGDKYPNPFCPTTTITYSIPDSVHVIIVIYNVLGEIVDTVENQYRLPGTYEVEPDCALWESGIYFYRLTAGEFTKTKKMVLLK